MSNQISENNKRIAKNTLHLYFRMFLIMLVTFVYEPCLKTFKY